VVAAARDALDQWGYGMASVRFICGTQEIHKELEQRLSAFLGQEDTILYSSCFDANGGVFETLLGAEDAVISDALNHASIIDGVRLCKARRLRYANADMDELEQRLKESKDARRRLIATDGVFSMDGFIAPLPRICELAERYGAMVMVDDSHAVGFVGPTGRGTPELFDVIDRVDITKADGSAPHEVLLVIDGNTGQNALAQVKAFDEALTLTGLIVTKLDGTAKGGVLCAIARERPVPVYFVGVGEKLADLQTFRAREFAAALVD